MWHVTVDGLVGHLGRQGPPGRGVEASIAALATAVTVLDCVVGASEVPVLLWVPLVVAATVAGLRIAVLGMVALAAVAGIVGQPSGAAPSTILADLSGRVVVLVLVAAATRWTLGAVDELARRSRVDAATGLLNRAGFLAVLERERERSVRGARPISLVYLDLDGLKQANDRFGHAAGDELLVRFADHLQATRRTIDVAARLGGDEFALLLPDTDGTGTSQVLDRLFRAVDPDERCLSMSAGAVSWVAPPSVAAMLRAADDVMYGVKRDGGRAWTAVDLDRGRTVRGGAGEIDLRDPTAST